jgi:hypothetical protein
MSNKHTEQVGGGKFRIPNPFKNWGRSKKAIQTSHLLPVNNRKFTSKEKNNAVNSAIKESMQRRIEDMRELTTENDRLKKENEELKAKCNKLPANQNNKIFTASNKNNAVEAAIKETRAIMQTEIDALNEENKELKKEIAALKLFNEPSSCRRRKGLPKPRNAWTPNNNTALAGI